MNAQLHNLSDLVVCEWCERDESAAADKRDGESIAKHGILDPLIAVRDGARLILADGLRRKRLASAYGISKAPVLVKDAPPGVSAEKHAERLRFIINFHRQDPPPSVRALLIQEQMNVFGFTQKEVAKNLGLEEDTITNWLRVLTYPREIVRAIDAGKLPLSYAYAAFKGMTTEGQSRVWKHHWRQIVRNESIEAIRAKYPAEKYPAFWIESKPRKKQDRKVKPLSDVAKRKLLNSKTEKLAELHDAREDREKLERQCVAAGPLALAFLRHKDMEKAAIQALRELFPDDDPNAKWQAIRFELETFEQSY
jgi:ParB/RepB/Spo0J family partition protein